MILIIIETVYNQILQSINNLLEKAEMINRDLCDYHGGENIEYVTVGVLSKMPTANVRGGRRSSNHSTTVSSSNFKSSSSSQSSKIVVLGPDKARCNHLFQTLETITFDASPTNPHYSTANFQNALVLQNETLKANDCIELYSNEENPSNSSDATEGSIERHISTAQSYVQQYQDKRKK